MLYHANSGQFTIEPQKLKDASYSFLYALRNIRRAAGLPLDKYTSDGNLSPADHAQKGIIDGAKALGVDLGAEWGCELDLRDGA